MSGVDIAAITVVAVLFFVALGYIVYRKAKGKGGCDCGGGCDGNCAHCGGCDCEREKKSGNVVARNAYTSADTRAVADNVGALDNCGYNGYNTEKRNKEYF